MVFTAMEFEAVYSIFYRYNRDHSQALDIAAFAITPAGKPFLFFCVCVISNIPINYSVPEVQNLPIMP